MADENFSSKSVGLRAQKKLLSKMATKKIAKVFIDETAGNILDNLYKVAKQLSDKKTAEKTIKNLIKTVIKIGILYRNEQFSKDELMLAESFKKKFHTVAMTIISFYEVDFTFDKNFLAKNLQECSSMLKKLVQNHLTEKSLNRIDYVFNFFGNAEYLDKMFLDRSYKVHMDQIVRDLNTMLENGSL